MTFNQRMYKRLQALILVLTAIFFAQKFWSGQLYYYIGSRFGWLALLAVVLLVAIAGAYNLTEDKNGEDSQDHVDHNHPEYETNRNAWPLVIVALPLVLGVLIPPTPLGASAVSARGMSTDVAVSAGTNGTLLTVVPSERNLLDWVRIMNENPDPAAVNGQEANIIGFVYRDVRFDNEQFMVGRFTLTCCVADALAIGVVVQTDNADEFTTDSWVQVQGIFEVGELGGDELPVLKATQIIPIQQPEQPYLYP